MTNRPSIHQSIADNIPQIKRGRVWCLICHHSLKIDGAKALKSGWPKCCGQTMTIDSPEERVLTKHQKTGIKGNHE